MSSVPGMVIWSVLHSFTVCKERWSFALRNANPWNQTVTKETAHWVIGPSDSWTYRIDISVGLCLASPPLVPVLNQISRVHTLMYYISKSTCNIFLSSMGASSKQFLPFGPCPCYLHIISNIWVIAASPKQADFRKVCEKDWFIIKSFCWALFVVWCIFDVHDVSGLHCTPVFR
jgi:hypothetical protein